MNKKLVCICMLLFATVISVAGTGNFDQINNPTTSEDIDNWSMLCHDAAHSGFSTSTSPETNDILFVTTGVEAILGGISARNGIIYVSSFSRHLYFIDAYTGDILFVHNNPSVLTSVPAIDDENIYFGSFDHNVYCLNATTGNEVWTYDSGGDIYSSPALYDDKIYIGGYNNKMMCIDTDGNEVWTYTVGGYAYSPAVVDSKVYFGSHDNKVYCLNADNGSYIWHYATGGDIKTAVSVANGNVYVSSQDDILYCLDAVDGSVEWTFPLSVGSKQAAPIVNNDKVYIGSYDNKFYCINAETGIEIWNYSASDVVYSTAAVADGKVYFADWGRVIYCVDAGNGAEIWTYLGGNVFQSALAIYDGTLYVAANSYLYAFGTLDNEAPVIPDQPDGPTEGEIDVEYSFSTTTIDPDGDQVYYMWDFGDEQTNWIGPYDSGVEVSENHIWTVPGIYEVKVKAKDIFEEESSWSDILEVTITEPLPELSIELIVGGLGVATVINNTGDAIATNVNYTLSVTGGIFNLINVTVTDVEAELVPDGEIIIETGVFFGLGPIEINVTVSADGVEEFTKTTNGFIFFVFVIIG